MTWQNKQNSEEGGGGTRKEVYEKAKSINTVDVVGTNVPRIQIYVHYPLVPCITSNREIGQLLRHVTN
jgi:hypothetical protein